VHSILARSDSLQQRPFTFAQTNHMTCSAVRERICTHRTFTLGSTDSPGFNNPSTLNS
jgi:hypothetical protein